MKKWWFIEDPSQGHSGGIAYFVDALQTALKAEIRVIQVTDRMRLDGDGEPDGIVLWCALRWYVRNRASIPGRPWVGALSWCFDDLMSVIADKAVPGINLIDSGISALWTNCPAYVQQTSAAYQCTFSFKPIHISPPKRALEVRYPHFCAVLPNIKDRDFSQLLWTLRRLKVTMGPHFGGMQGPKIYLAPGERERLPSQIIDVMDERSIIRCDTETHLNHVYDDFSYMINAPRITDIRGGVVPPEIYMASSRGCTPLVITHPVWANQLTGLPTFRSLTRYGAVLDQIVNGTAGPMGIGWSPQQFAAGMECHVGLAWKLARAYEESTYASAI